MPAEAFEGQVMNVRHWSLVGAVLAVLVLAGPLADAQQTVPDLSGAWQIDRESSDLGPGAGGSGDRDAGGPGGRPPRGGPGGGMGLPGMGGGRGEEMDPEKMARARERMRAVLEAQERLVITQKPGEVAIVDGSGHTDRLVPDGKKRDQLTNAGMTKMKSSWVGATLVWETDYGEGLKVERTFAVETAGAGGERARRLKFGLRVERSGMSRPLEMTRYYDPQ